VLKAKRQQQKSFASKSGAMNAKMRKNQWGANSLLIQVMPPADVTIFL